MDISKRIYFTICLMLIIGTTEAQLGIAGGTNGALNNVIRERHLEETMLKDMKNSKLNYFLDKDWKAGVMFTSDGSSISGLLYRYNVYTDQIEFRSFVNPEIIDVLSIGSKKFIYTNYETDIADYTESGYFELIARGECKLLIKRQMSFDEGTNDQEAYGSSSSTKIVERYYIKKGDQPATIIERNKNSLMELLSDKKEFEDYMDNKLLLIITEKRLIDLINYYNKI
ncbi:MAG: hypothetical protein KAQ75_11635 [Bacteroidales bacterium]|nr:hypothetical protein [Bacteroidales bacterium]